MKHDDHSEDWRDQALCRGVVAADGNFDTFFPKGDEFVTRNSPARTTPRAALMCEKCPVQVQCEDYAMFNKIPYGTWGGRNRSERATTHKRRVAARREYDPDVEAVAAQLATSA